MQVRAMRGRTDFDVRFVFWLIPLWINFRSLLFTCWLILPLIFWPPSFSGTGNESQKNTCNISLKFGVFCNILLQRGWWRTGWYHIAEKNAWKNQARSQEACLKKPYKKHSYTKKKLPYKANLEPLNTISMEIDIGIAHRLGHGIFFVWHAVKYVVGQTNVSAFTQIMF